MKRSDVEYCTACKVKDNNMLFTKDGPSVQINMTSKIEVFRYTLCKCF